MEKNGELLKKFRYNLKIISLKFSKRLRTELVKNELDVNISNKFKL